MMQEMCAPLRSKLMSFDGRVLKSIFVSREYISPSQRLPNYSKFQLSKTYIPCVSKCDTRSFHSSHSAPTSHNRLLGYSSLLLSQKPLSHCQNFPSITLHTSPDGNVKLFQTIPSVSSRVGILDLESLSQELSTHNQLRSLHGYSSRRRAGRTFSSQEKSIPSSADKDSEQKDSKDAAETDDKKLTVYQRFKKTYKEHGKVLVAVHLMTSAVWFGTFYTASRCGVDIVPLLESWNLSEKVISPFRSGGLGDVALAYLMYKLATPARYTVTLGGTNMALRYLKKEGKMQQVPKEDSLRELYKDGKEDLKSKGQNTRHRLKHMRHRLQGRIQNTRHRLRRMRHRIQGRIRRARRRHPHDKRDRN